MSVSLEIKGFIILCKYYTEKFAGVYLFLKQNGKKTTVVLVTSSADMANDTVQEYTNTEY